MKYYILLSSRSKILFVTCINKGAFKIIQTLTTPLGCQPETDDKKLLLMIAQP